MVTTTDNGWDAAAARRAVRLLGSHAPRIDDPQGTARALRLVWDIIHRRGAPTDIFQIPGTMPLVAVGHGPILLVTHLDDPHPLAQVDEAGPPTVNGDDVSNPGITRKAGLLSALGAVLADETIARQVTLVIEADRHNGSQAITSWIDSSDRAFSAALCEVADLPIPAPALFLSNTGVVTAKVALRSSDGVVESAYGGVQPDIVHELVSTLASLKSAEGEVLVPGFYDGVTTPDTDGLGALQRVAAPVGAWLTRGLAPSDDRLSSSHLTLGAFLAPSIVIRELHVIQRNPYLPTEATATVEARIMPGQDGASIARAITEFIQSRIPSANIDAPDIRPPARPPAIELSGLDSFVTVIPVAAGNSPAGLFDAVGIPTIGFSTVWRDPSQFEEHVSLSSIEANAGIIQDLIVNLSKQLNNDAPA